MLPPCVTAATPSVLVMERSATAAPSGVGVDALLLPATGSGVLLVAVTVFTIGSGVV